MKIRFVIIKPAILSKVQAEVDALSGAVNAGDMAAVDIITVKLMKLTEDCHSVDLNEKEWKVFLSEVRDNNTLVYSNYLIPGELCSSILPTATDRDVVLELPMDEDDDAGAEE